MPEEKESILSFSSELLIDDDFFAKQQHLKISDIPNLSYMLSYCEGLITKPGHYSFCLQIKKLK